MASWLWRRLRGKRRPLTGFCFFLAMSVVVLTGFSPGFPGAPPEPPGWARRPPRAMDVPAPAGPKAPSSRQPGRIVPQGARGGRVSPESPGLVCKDDGGSRGRGRSRAPLGKSSSRRAKRDVAAAPTVATQGESSATSLPGVVGKVLPGMRDARGQRAKDPGALRPGWQDAGLPELPPGTEPDGGLSRMPSAVGPPALASLPKAFRAAGGWPAPRDAALQAAGAGEAPGAKGRAGSHGQVRTAPRWPALAGELRASAWCRPGEGGPPGAGESPPWFTEDDVQKMRLLAHGEVTGRARVPGHGQVLRVGLLGRAGAMPPDLGRLCSEGRCGLIKRAQDLAEVLAFHLDRVLGLSRSLPAVARRFHSPLLPYRFTRGAPRPVVWWAPDVRHLNDSDNDQNSFALGWQRYQALLQLRCGSPGSGAPLAKPPCLGVHHAEWARLALFDFLLQVHDRLDRHCCGFEPEPSDPCLEERLREKCRNPGELLLVHILVRESDPSHLVYIDNAGKLLHPQSKLNFRLLEGIDGFPESAVKVIASGCLENFLLKSLRTDPEFWDSQGGPQGLKPLLLTITERAQVLLDYIRERNLTLFGEEAGGGHRLPLT